MAYTGSFQPARGGLRWVRSKVASGTSGPPIVELFVKTANTAGIFTGDPVRMQDAGDAYPCAVNETTYAVCIGAANYKLADGTTRPGTFVPAATAFTGDAAITNPLATRILAIPVHGQVFEIDAYAAIADEAAAQTLVGNCCDYNVGAGGSTVTGQSSFTADVGSPSASTAQLKILSISRYGKDNSGMNNVKAANWKLEVEIYEEQTAPV